MDKGTRCTRLSSGRFIVDSQGDYVFDGQKMVPVNEGREAAEKMSDMGAVDIVQCQKTTRYGIFQ